MAGPASADAADAGCPAAGLPGRHDGQPAHRHLHATLQRRPLISRQAAATASKYNSHLGSIRVQIKLDLSMVSYTCDNQGS